MIKLRYPVIAAQGKDPMQLLHSYLFQLVDELNVALSNVETTTKDVRQTGTAIGNGETTAETAFNDIKGLIIKSADIVNAYYEVISRRLSGVYVAKSDFGTYTEQTEQTIEENSQSISQLFSNMQQILTDVGAVENSMTDVNAHIKSGLLYYDDQGVPVYGLEIGQRTKQNGVEVFNKYARFTSEKLSFYDQNNNEVAYISDRKLYITQIEVTDSYRIGRLVDTAMADGSVVTRYIAMTGGDG